MNSKLESLLDHDINRRDLLKTAGIGAMSLGIGGLIAGCGGSGSNPITTPTSSATDLAVLNFALNLEYLEAEFYAYATTGSGLSPSLFTGTGNQGPTTGGKQVTLDAATMKIATEIANDEMLHVVDLRTALGANAIAKPAINLNALGIGFANQTQFLTLARAFEDVGVSAYVGASPLLSNTYIETAAKILAVEAYHAGNIRLQVAQQGIVVSPVDSNDVPPPPAGTLYFTTDANGLALARSTRQVLDIVYASTGSSGGFFPSGFNGTITN